MAEIGLALREWLGPDADISVVADLVRARMFDDHEATANALTALSIDHASLLSAVKIFTVLTTMIAFRAGSLSGDEHPAAYSVACVNEAENGVRAMMLEP